MTHSVFLGKSHLSLQIPLLSSSKWRGTEGESRPSEILELLCQSCSFSSCSDSGEEQEGSQWTRTRAFWWKLAHKLGQTDKIQPAKSAFPVQSQRENPTKLYIMYEGKPHQTLYYVWMVPMYCKVCGGTLHSQGLKATFNISSKSIALLLPRFLDLIFIYLLFVAVLRCKGNFSATSSLGSMAFGPAISCCFTREHNAHSI